MPLTWTYTHTLTHDKKIKISFNKTDMETTKSKYSSDKDPITRACQIGAMVLM